MSTGLLIVGAGGHGKVVADSALQQACWEKLAFLDDAPERGEAIVGLPVLGGLPSAAGLRDSYPNIVVAIGDARRRLQLMRQFEALGFKLPVIRHPAATVSPFARLGEGCVVFAESVINADADLGSGCIVNTGATIDHDCVLADGVHVSPGANLGGGVRIGKASWIGIGACVRECIAIGDHVIVGAGAAVVDDVDNGLTVVGVPAAVLSTHNNRP